ncbi:patatin-like phospholipase family protein [Neptunicella sp. SCSIO 80796]|uniref:patatin-like phospholipase family protein n=1 Tax=Neptunicella plasticusilytica TaxID=3117012 RepID=UPI003A4E27D9
MQVLDIYAGPRALKTIQQQGFHQQLFSCMLGASGGPKWFVLAGLDRVIMPEFFVGRTTPLDLLGSSAGSFRFACYAQQDPLAAINRLAHYYSHTVYSDKPDNQEITDKGWQLLDKVLENDGVNQILQNPLVRAHFVVARCLGFTRSESKGLQLTGLLSSAVANKFNRARLQRYYQRFVFSSPGSQLIINDPYQMPIYPVDLNAANLQSALMASGSIPIVLKGVRDIADAPPGIYRDGGIIDYHFDLQVTTKNDPEGLVLYPHFFAQPVPGWFDKTNGRKPHAASYDNVVMVVPSAEFVASLPYAKIPDRKDFETMPAEQRIRYWQAVLSESDRLGEAFMQLATEQNGVDRIKPFSN